jgi:mitochondrial fission protein ELM1
MSRRLIIWQFTDGKPGHENQTRGLIQAMAAATLVKSHTIDVPQNFFLFLSALLFGGLYRQLSKLEKPDYLIAAGRRTHLPMLLAHLWFGGKRIVLMRPSWPVRWFDMLIIPYHDHPKKSPNILATQGAINTITPSSTHNKNQGIILIGGPSKHYHWNTISIVQQISLLLQKMPEVSWLIINSRRTPEDFLVQLQTMSNNYTFIDHRQTHKGWLPKQLASAGQIWVSPDSVSMIYEALTSGGAVGCFDLEKNGDNRIVNGIDELMTNGMLSSFSQWQSTHQLTQPAFQLNEAQRTADWILNQ